jgi:galactose mutarotase-like enzyme
MSTLTPLATMFTISNQQLQVQISAKGAELQSIFNVETNLEYLWDGNPDIWPKQSPIMFPVCGGLKNEAYTYNGKEYKLGRHGFTRDFNFEVSEQHDNSVTFALSSNQQTLAAYPFPFMFYVKYTVNNNMLTVSLTAENTGSETMYFSFGGHPGFKVPVTKDTSYQDYYLQFNQVENAGRIPGSPDGLMETYTVDFFDNTDKLPLTKELFYKEALVFKGLQSTNVSLLNSKTQNGLKVSFEGFPYLILWAVKDADFICIEPWAGISDMVNTTGKLEDKEGILSLPARQKLTKEFTIEVF